VDGDFLEVDIDQDIHMKLGRDIAEILSAEDDTVLKHIRNDGSIAVKLNKALYGTIQASRLWYDKLTTVLIANGFSVNAYDKCVLYKNFNGCNIVLALHVDDVLISATSSTGLQHVKSVLAKAFHAINFCDDRVIEYLGMQITNQSDGILVGMPGYSSDCADSVAGSMMLNSKCKAPADSKLFDIDADSPALDDGKRKSFHSAVAKVLYLATKIRPELLPTVSFLSSRVLAPTEEDWSKLQKLMSYVSNTVNYGIKYYKGQSTDIKAYIDASHGTHYNDGTSRSGILITMAGGCICAKSARQKIVTLSSTEAELVALTEGSNYVVWLRNLLNDMRLKDPGPTVIYQDNKSTIALIENAKTKQQRTRHVNAKYFAIRQRIVEGYVRIEHLSGLHMLADVMTKGVDAATLSRLLPAMMYVAGI
jgi:hypothetical protein